jgi:pimeloyl-ACP methyl ester carboxylesterase
VRFLNRSLIGISVVVFVLATAGMLYQTAATEADQRNFPPPGMLVNVDGYKMHIYCTGEGSPTVILDGSNMATVSNWAWVQPEISRTTRVCAYDRADTGWSDISPEANDTEANARALHTLLAKAGEPAPYVLVGHSFGGLYTRMYAEMYPQEVAGMVFVEGTLPDGLKQLGKPDVMPNAADENMMDMLPVISRLGLLRLLEFPSTDPDLPEPQRSELQSFLASDKWAEMIKRQNRMFPVLLAQVRPLYGAGSLGDRPLAVIVGSEVVESIPEWNDLFVQQAALSTNHLLVTVEGATHNGIVARRGHALQTSDIILKVVEAVRSDEPLE